MKIFNTLSLIKESFRPLKKPEVGLYSCGPTVYNIAHIGNLRAYVFVDVLKRILFLAGYKVKHVMNITDVDDKTIKASEGKKEAFSKLTKDYEKLFFQNLEELNILKPDEVTRATEYINQMAHFIEDLLKKGYAYKAKDNSIYFSISKFKNYGKLSRLDKEGIKAGARVSQDEYAKENPSDFALWKAWNKDDGDIYWDPSTWLGAETSLGKGRPGWHIECSTMSTDKLGNTFDIHTGGVDNIFPHHENEIAQAEARTGQPFVQYWMHCEHLLVDGKKMSKSLGNYYNLQDISKRGYSPLDFRYFLLGAHYRSKVNFTWDGLTAAKNSRERLNRILEGIKTKDIAIDRSYMDKFKQRVFDDLDTAGGLAILWEMLRDENLSEDKKYGTAIEMDQVFGLKFSENREEEIPEEIVRLVEERDDARRAKDFALSDKIRNALIQKGWTVEDTSTGSKVSKQ